LGKTYRMIDDADLVDAIVPTLINRGAKLAEFSIDERRLHAKFLTGARDVQAIKLAYAEKYHVDVAQVGRHLHIDGKDISWVNEMVATGVVIRHSEIGFASIGASFFTRIIKCLNDYTSESAVALRHVGGKNGTADDGDVRLISGATQALEDAALLGRVEDAIQHALSDGEQAKHAIALIAGKTDVVERPKDEPLFEFVGALGTGLGLTQQETESLKEETLKATMEEGGETRFAFAQGLTAVAREMTDYDRRLAFEREGFALLEGEAGDLFKLAKDGEAKQAKATPKKK